MYYITKEGNLYLYSDNKNALKDYGYPIKNLAGVKASNFDNNKYIVNDDLLIENPNYEAEQAEKERRRIANLNMTAADVERAIYKVKGMDFDDMIALVEDLPMTESEQPSIDIKALKIELRANNFYRGNPYIDTVGALLGFSKKQLDEFFETNDYTKLM